MQKKKRRTRANAPNPSPQAPILMNSKQADLASESARIAEPSDSLTAQSSSPTLELVAANAGSSSEKSATKSMGWSTFDNPKAEGIYWKLLKPGQYKIRWRNPDGTWGSSQVGIATREEAEAQAILKRLEIDEMEVRERKKSVYRALGKEHRVSIEVMCLAWKEQQDALILEKLKLKRDALKNDVGLSVEEADRLRRAKDALREVRVKCNALRNVTTALNLQFFDQIKEHALERIVAHYAGEEDSPYGYRVIRYLKEVVRYVAVTCNDPPPVLWTPR